MSTPWLVSIVVALIGAVGAYLAAVKKLSGKVRTSEATDLWAESKNIRDDYRSRITELNDVLARCEERIEALEQRNDELYAANGRLGRMIEEHEATIKELRSQVHRLSDENGELKLENRGLRIRLTELESA